MIASRIVFDRKAAFITALILILFSAVVLAAVFSVVGNSLSYPSGNQTQNQTGTPIAQNSSASNVSAASISSSLSKSPILSNNSAFFLSSQIPISWNNPMNLTLFSITGVTGTAYVRCSIGDYYSDGNWYADPDGVVNYTGGVITQSVPASYGSRADEQVEITPEINLVDFIPAFKGTEQIAYTETDAGLNLLYFTNDQAFYSPQPISNQYEINYSVFTYEWTALENAMVGNDSKYLGVPSDMSGPLKELAESITANATTSYDKAEALESYLRSNYEYSFNYTAPQNGTDPVIWFLFHDKEGVCIQFNSAFVLLARSVGLPARLVVGFLVDPLAQYQTVKASQAHAYSEVFFDNLGWVTFDATGSTNRGNLDSDSATTMNPGASNSSGMAIQLPLGPVKLTYDPLFIIYGVTGTNYTRDAVGEEYINGTWYSNSSNIMSYDGEEITPSVEPEPQLLALSNLITNPLDTNVTILQTAPMQISGYLFSQGNDEKVTISPLVPMKNSIETFEYTHLVQMISNATTALYYDVDSQIFDTTTAVSGEYAVSFNTYTFDPSVLDIATVPAGTGHLDVPASIAQDLGAMAANVTSNASTPYEKVVAIEDYLKSNYVYSLNMTSPQNGTDPVIWFLFHDKEGDSIDFNSAFVLMARTLGIPARIVEGYAINPNYPVQTVLAKDACAYSEVLFDNLGWVSFDATPTENAQMEYNGTNQPGAIQTSTNITSCDPVGLAGKSFGVNGTVMDENGLPVSGLNVIINLTPNGSASGFEVGEGNVINGTFNIICRVPVNRTLGQYQVIAQTMGNGVYNGSRSDPSIIIESETIIAVWAPQEGVIGSNFTIKGQLIQKENSQVLADMPLEVVCGNQTFDLITDGNGCFSTNTSLGVFGSNNITVSFVGQQYYLNSTATRTIMVPRFSIIPLSQNLIRGESNLLMCRLMAHVTPVGNESLQVMFNSTEVGNGITDKAGYLTLLYNVPKGYPLGNITLGYTFEPYNVASNQIVTVMAKTSIQASQSLWNPLQITAELVDDEGQPIVNQPLVATTNVSKANYTGFTDGAGSVSFQLGVPELNQSGGVSYVVKFNGSSLFLPSTANGTIAIVSTTAAETDSLLAGAIAGAVGLSMALVVFRRRSKRKGSMLGPLAPVAKAEDKDGEKGASPWSFEISFPKINPSLPNTWGVGEAMEVTIRSTGAETDRASMVIDDGPEEKIETGRGVFSRELLLGKGDHLLSIHVDGKKVKEVPVRVVDYKEEIVRVYNEYFSSIKGQVPGVGEEMTPREFEEVAKRNLGVEKHAALDNVVSIFEVANYSLHPIARSDYAGMYLSLVELR